MFDALKVKNECVAWIRRFFEENGKDCNGRVANTCNLSEDWVGYSTRYGDAAGDFSPCSRPFGRGCSSLWPNFYIFAKSEHKISCCRFARLL